MLCFFPHHFGCNLRVRHLRCRCEPGRFSLAHVDAVETIWMTLGLHIEDFFSIFHAMDCEEKKRILLMVLQEFYVSLSHYRSYLDINTCISITFTLKKELKLFHIVLPVSTCINLLLQNDWSAENIISWSFTSPCIIICCFWTLHQLRHIQNENVLIELSVQQFRCKIVIHL